MGNSSKRVKGKTTHTCGLVFSLYEIRAKTQRVVAPNNFRHLIIAAFGRAWRYVKQLH